ncbi:MAG: endonuclease/exonuclease/phosphatase family protein [Pirellulaceae bacterium]|nr:endonuclease/exonuclease/phosphatase family protein [Pirellulaceae bacterium]
MMAKKNRFIPCFCLPFLLVVGQCVNADPPIRPDEGLPVVSWENAESVIGRTAAVVGRVLRVGHAKRVHFLNFDRQRRDVFSVVLFEDAMAKFQPDLETLYENKLIRVRGRVSLYRDVPQIVVSAPEQIQVLDKLPEFVSISAASNVPPAKNELTVGSFNLLNLFDDRDDPYRSDESTAAKPRAQLAKAAARIRAMNADVLALQEVESRGYLQRFVDVFLAKSGYRHVVLLEGNDARGIDVALLSRVPIGRVSSHRHKTFVDARGKPRRLSRDLLQVEILPRNGAPFEVWVVHLKSNSGGREAAEPIRLSEVTQIRKIYDDAVANHPTARILLCGDFNDTLESATISRMLASPQNSLQSLLDGQSDRVTYNRRPYQSMIDFIFASPAMAKSFVTGSYQILDGTVESGGSDHNPVYARFRLN